MCEEFPDDPVGVRDAERLLRRVHIKHFVMDVETQRPRLSSAAFNDPEMSVCVVGKMVDHGRDPREVLAGHPNDMLVAIRAGWCRRLGLAVALDPLPEEAAHAIVYGSKKKKVVIDGIRLKVSAHLRQQAEWVVPLAEPTLEMILETRRNAGLEPGQFRL